MSQPQVTQARSHSESCKIKVFVWGKATILKFVEEILDKSQWNYSAVSDCCP